MKNLLKTLIGILFVLQCSLWFGDKNAFDLYRLQKTTQQTQQENIILQQQNNTHIAEVNDLKEGGETVETLARSQFGLIKQDETFYQIIE